MLPNPLGYTMTHYREVYEQYRTLAGIIMHFLPAGILKKRGLGEASLARTKSAPNIISLKPQASAGKMKKRISFGKDEIRMMEASPGIKARLGFGRCSSPPKERHGRLTDNPQLIVDFYDVVNDDVDDDVVVDG